jgi:ribosome maturation factor RimP
MEDVAKIRQAIEAKLAGMGLELYDIKFNRAGRHSSLRVFIDKPEGVTVADCEQASHEISVLLDVEEFSNTPYNLEVSSPGADRPLKSEKYFKRATGKDVQIVYLDEAGKSRPLIGTLTAYDGNAARIQTATGETTIRRADILSAKMELQF